ncbi:MAG: hypothetical protein Q8K58_15475 [Acidimicrobiales bacterium]|nr:hypothetical protein [Acidimicrobiales bacterium]
MGTRVAARQATTDDVPGMAAALAQAFRDDPVMAWLFGDDQARTVRRLEPFFAHEGARHLRHPTVYTTDGHAGAAYWDPPGAWKTRPVEMLPMAPLMIRSMGPRIPRALKGWG